MSLENNPKSSAHTEKIALHPRNKHKGRYDFRALVECNPALAKFVLINQYNDETIDFSNPEAVKLLNRALLSSCYGISEWDIPANYLCPPIPGRADYIHYIADLLSGSNKGKIPTGATVNVLDIGIGANCIYPILGHQEYGWHFVGSDIDPIALSSSEKIINKNNELCNSILLRQQANPANIFTGLLKPDDLFDITLCNPPFHESLAAAESGTQRKWKNLGKGVTSGKSHSQAAKLNFGGQGNELCCDGGEASFIRRMIEESTQFSTQCLWFSTLVSKESNLGGIYRALKKARVLDSRTIEMAQGQKKSRIVAWTYLNTSQHEAWYKHSINRR